MLLDLDYQASVPRTGTASEPQENEEMSSQKAAITTLDFYNTYSPSKGT